MAVKKGSAGSVGYTLRRIRLAKKAREMELDENYDNRPGLKKYSLKWTAGRAGISSEYLCNMEKGKMKKSRDELLFEVTHALGVTMIEFDLIKLSEGDEKFKNLFSKNIREYIGQDLYDYLYDS